jgi:uncharacterized membrane protein
VVVALAVVVVAAVVVVVALGLSLVALFDLVYLAVYVTVVDAIEMDKMKRLSPLSGKRLLALSAKGCHL